MSVDVVEERMTVFKVVTGEPEQGVEVEAEARVKICVVKD